ncbi:MAG: riboflavin synthase [Desulfobacterales bacterium]|nr:riboflavin synthase [Desulfobacterales bacterium]
MFTGIVECVGRVVNLLNGSSSGKLTINAKKILHDVRLGDSIAVNGVCLTVTSFTSEEFTADVMPVTLQKTNLGQLKVGQGVNLEKAIQLNSRLGGHLLSGHIDEVGEVVRVEQADNAVLIEVRISDKLKPFVIKAGSIALNGVSLTVAELTVNGLIVSIVPHTAVTTNLSRLSKGDLINLEGDVVGKYIYHIWQLSKDCNNAQASSEISKHFLVENRFI